MDKSVSPSDRTRELRLRVALVLSHKCSPSQAYALVETFGSLEAAIQEKDSRLAEVQGITVPKIKAWRAVIREQTPDTEIQRCMGLGVSLVMLEDENYPRSLRSIPDPPLLLWIRGEVTASDALALAIVGSRNCDIYGQKQAERFAHECATRGITVVSGLARGIDTHAHRATLAAKGRTIAVVGSGLASLYPPENVVLSQQVTAYGALISEFSLDCPAHPRNFPQRNRLISGLALGVLVAQASTRSGSLISARLAGEQGREVFAIPGKIDSTANAGCHALIRDGAALVESFEDIVREIPAFGELQAMPSTMPAAGGKTPSSAPSPSSGTHAEQQLLALIPLSDPITIDELVSTSKFEASRVAATLTTLELRGMIRRLPGGNFVRA